MVWIRLQFYLKNIFIQKIYTNFGLLIKYIFAIILKTSLRLFKNLVYAMVKTILKMCKSKQKKIKSPITVG